MTKTTTVPHLLEQLDIQLYANGIHFDTARCYGIKVNLEVTYNPVGERYDEANVQIGRITTENSIYAFTDDHIVTLVEIASCANIADLIPKSQVAAIEENLLAQMAGEG